MSNTEKRGCLKSQGIRLPLSSFPMDTHHTLWSRSPPLRGLVTGIAHQPSHPQTGICFEGQRRLADDARLVGFSGVLIRWAPIEGSVARLQKPTLHHLTRPPKHLSPVLLQLQHQFNNEQEQLTQLRHETDGFWSKLIIATSPLWYWKGLHNNSSLFLTSIFLQKATSSSLTSEDRSREANCTVRVFQSRTRQSYKEHSGFLHYAGEFSKCHFAVLEWKPPMAFLCSWLVGNGCLA